MLKFDIITIFPQIFDSYFGESIIKRAEKKKLIKIKIHNLRDFTDDKHKKVDDKPYGGGPGMIIKVEPIAKAVNALTKNEKSKKKTKIILFSAGGKQFTNSLAKNLAEKCSRIIMISGRYEGVDERVKQVIKNLGLSIQEISIGDYVLTGGELPAMVIVDSVSRHIKGVLGKEESLEEKRYGVGLPVYTRPENFVWKQKKYKAPNILLSGNHQKINEWRLKHKK